VLALEYLLGFIGKRYCITVKGNSDFVRVAIGFYC
jgi:hypothetical protein